MKHDEMTCQALILKFLFEYEERTMPEEDRREFEKHVSLCPPCVTFLSTYRATGKTLKMLKPGDIPPTLADTVIAFVKARRERGK